MYDASSYYSGGIFDGNEIRIGNPQLCRDLNEEFVNFFVSLNPTRSSNSQTSTTSSSFPQDGNISHFVPFGVRNVNAKYKLHIDYSPLSIYTITQTVCMPESCTPMDLMQVMSYNYIPNLRNNIYVTSSELIAIRIIKGNYEFYEDFSFYFLV